MIFPSPIHNPRSAIGAPRPGLALPMTIIAVAGLTLLLVGLMTVLTLERKTARSYSDAARADLAVESGLAVTIAQITNFLNRPDVAGAAFATWAYHPGGGTTPGHLLALTAGRPDFDNGTTGGTPYLSLSNTQWLGTAGDNPDTLLADFQSGNSDVIDFNAKNALGEQNGLCLARWQTISTDPDGRQTRYAVWVDDETSRLDVSQIGTLDREDGASLAEIPFFEAGKLNPEIADGRVDWRTPGTARIFLDETRFPKELSFASTSFSRGYDVLAYSPSFAETGISQENGYQLPLRGGLKRNLNWNGHLGPGTVDVRVGRLAEWMANGAKGFFNKRNLNFWPNVSGGSALAPDYNTLPTANPFASSLRKEQFGTIAASLIDYLDSDNVPTQPTRLAALDYGNPMPGASSVKLIQAVERPEYFGADRTIRINEVQIVWNSRGQPDNFLAKSSVTRTALAGGRFRYEIPVTFRYELWNMDQNQIPPASYEIRTTSCQEIQSGTFGLTGAESIPEERELVLPLNSGNPIAFAPNEIKVFNITNTYVRESSEDLGNTWNSFRLNSSGTSGPQPNTQSDQAQILLNAGTGEWLHATAYLQMSQAVVDGVVSVGPGNAGPSLGGRINDPRMSPLRNYDSFSPNGGFQANRDWAGNKPGKMSLVNNGTGSSNHNYQNFNFWLDKPYLLSINSPLEGITRVENRPMRTLGELGRIFDPSWTHPAGRGGATSPLNRGVRTPFYGGSTLAIGQRSQATLSGTTAADHLDAKPWNIMDVFTIDGDGFTMTDEEYGSLEWSGRVNINSQKNFVLTTGIKTNHELVMELPSLGLAAAARPTEFRFKAVAAALKNRLTKGGVRPDGTPIATWNDALPLYSPGQLSELESWNSNTSFNPPESNSGNDLALVNRSDSAREEAMMRSANFITTRSHCYRIVAAGEVRDSGGRVIGQQRQEKVIFFICTWDTTTGELNSVKPEILYVRSL